MAKRKRIWWRVEIDGVRTGVAVMAYTAGAAARKAFRQLIKRHKNDHRPLKNQPQTDGEGGWKGTRIMPIPRS